MRLPDFALERYFARWEFKAEMLLCASDVEGWTASELLALATEKDLHRWRDLKLGYTESMGDPELRAAIAGLYTGVEPDEILVFSGAEEAIFALNNVLLSADDHAIVVSPAYQSLAEVARAADAQITRVHLYEQNDWRLNPAEIRNAIRGNTRLILLNEPHNPTGGLTDRASFDQIALTANEFGVRLIVDEVYRFLEFDESERLPAAVETSPIAVSIGVMSKSFALAGLRIGWVATHDRALLHRLAAFKDYTSICSSAPSEVLALIALRAREQVLARNRAVIAANLPILDDFFERWAGTFEWIRPRGGSIGFPRLLTSMDVDSFAEQLVAETGVLVLPGSVFGDRGNHFRLGFGRTNMPEGLAKLESFAMARVR
jgi:aspartate/methionine/tyrosine aminotransferase